MSDSLRLHPWTDHGVLQARILEWVATLFSSGSSQPRDRNQVSCITGRFFTSWAIRKPLFWFISVQSLSCVRLFATPWIAAYRPHCPSPTPGVHSDSRPLSQWCHPAISSCCPLLLLPPIPPSIRVFSSESTLRMRWPKYWSLSFNIIPSKKSQGWSPSEWTGWISVCI